MRLYDDRRGSSAARGYGYAWQVQRKQYLGAHPYCACGQRATVVDHIIRRTRGGADHVSNYAAMCARCHNRKTKAEQ
ncbi:MAG: HNH endonuclease signature motif containing protein [Nitrospirales bacterium]